MRAHKYRAYQDAKVDKPKRVQTKDEHPMQAEWDHMEPEPPMDGSVIAPPSGYSSNQSNRALLVLIKALERGIEQNTTATEAPIPRVDEQLIGKEYR